MKVLQCNKKFGKWQALVLMITGGTCYFTADYLDELISQIQETNKKLMEM